MKVIHDDEFGGKEMIKSWRPDNWEETKPSKYDGDPYDEFAAGYDAAIEDGADAILRALCVKANYVEWDEMEVITGKSVKTGRVRGWLIFIPNP